MKNSDTPEQNKKYYIPKRIAEALNTVYNYSLTVVEAPMGYGKTTAIKEFLRLSQANVLWIQLHDGCTESFWKSFCRQVSNVDEICQESLVKLGFPNDELYRREVIELLEEISFPINTVLVIDDYHLVQNPDVHVFLEELTQCKLTNFYIILVARYVKLKRLDELIVKQYINHITKEIFEFDGHDIRGYYKQCGIQLKEVEIHNLLALTEGWISALYLLMLHYIANGCFTNCASIYNLVEKAIYLPLSEETKKFLISICLFDQVTINQAIHMWQQDNALQLLNKISNKNALLSYDRLTKSYQLHSIFSTFLKEELAKLDITRKRQLYQRTAQWYEQTGDYLQAMHYYIISDDHDNYLKVFELDKGHSLTFEQKSNFDEYFTQCSVDIKLKHPVALLIYAFCLFTMNDIEQFSLVCRQFLTSLETIPDLSVTERDNLLGEYEMMMSLASYNNIAKMNQHQLLVNTYMHRPLSFLDTKGGWTFGLPSVLFMFYNKSGELSDTVRLINESMPLYYKLTNGHGRGAEAVMEAELYYYQGDMEKAEIAMHKAIYISTNYSQADLLVCALYIKLKLYLFHGDYKNAFIVIQEMRDLAHIQRAYNLMHTIDLCETFLLISLKQNECIASWIKKGDFSSSRLYFPAIPYMNMIYAQSLLLSKEYQRLLGITDECLATASIFPNTLGQIYLYIASAIANSQLFRDKQAIESLTKALDLALPDKLYLPFVEHEDFIMPILNKLNQKQAYRNKLDMIIMLSAKYKISRNKMLTEQAQLKQPKLTKREIEIAHLVIQGYTNSEIGELLYISVNTVKTQLKNVFHKLSIKSRTQLIQVIKDVKNHPLGDRSQDKSTIL